MPDKITRVVIIEDDSIIRQGFISVIEENDSIHCTGDYDTCEEAIKNIDGDQPDIILMDIELPGISGIEGIRRIKKTHPQIDFIVVTVHEDDEKVFDALCAGASGYLTKNISTQKLVDSINEVRNGGAPMSTSIARRVISSFHKSTASPLSPRETEILLHLSRGKSYSMIADELFINKETVRTHIKNIYQKLNVNSKSAALQKANKERLI
ncbi:MAG: response regulator transcription factor [Ignavibacteriales bacterium]|nr:MAG: response regulator transcription factor [Ignavibacteriales bacterium]